jgi:uncharacterized protein YkwD
MTMPRRSGIQLLAAVYLLIISAGLAWAQDDLTTTTRTLTSTQTVLTLTTTISSGEPTVIVTTDTLPDTTIKLPGAVPTMPIGSGNGKYGGNEFKNAVINTTNYWRAQHQAKPLSWDSTLAEFAQRHAEKCIWEHSVKSTS